MENYTAEVQEHVPLERIHQILSTISGSLAEDIIAERDDR